MNKDVVYIEPEDDITDIITKIENSKEKIVALVPPKKAGVFRSIVNIKLIAKAGATAEKTVVLVTVDPSIVKLAAATRLPVTKNLQSAPAIPELTGEDIATTEVIKEEVVEAPDGEVEATEVVEEVEIDEAEGDEDAAQSDSGEEEPEDSGEGVKAAKTANKGEKDDTSDKKPAKKGKKSGDATKKFSKEWFKAHKKLTIGVGTGAVLLVLLLVWMYVIAPSAIINIKVRTTTANFSEGVTFTTEVAKEDAEAGVFYLAEKKIETTTEVEFTATGQKNIGEKASGDVVVYSYFKEKGSIAINTNASFSVNGLAYTAEEGTTLSWNGTDTSECENTASASIIASGCLVSGRIKVVAAAPGTAYNIAATSNGWSATADVGVYSDRAMSGGTDDIITVVQQSDIEAARAELSATNESENKQKLLDSVEDKDAFIIDASFQQTVGDATSSPAVGEEAKSGKAKLTVVTTDSIYVIDETKVKEFIEKKAKISDNYKIYEMNDPFIENFTKTDGGYVGKLKTSYTSGPSITENEVIEIVKGKGTGTATHDLSDMEGVSASITTSFPWVTSVPGDPNRITVIIDSGE